MIIERKPFEIKKRCYQFSLEVIKFIRAVKYERIYFSIFKQLLRSGTSIGANIVEAAAGSSKKDVVNFYHIALKSANETKYWLCLVRDTQPCEATEIKKLLDEAGELAKIIASSIIKMKT